MLKSIVYLVVLVIASVAVAQPLPAPAPAPGIKSSPYLAKPEQVQESKKF